MKDIFANVSYICYLINVERYICKYQVCILLSKKQDVPSPQHSLLVVKWITITNKGTE